MHYVNVKGILSPHNGMNIFRGCSHGCIYCDSRSKCYQINHDFEDIEIKQNSIELLEDALRRKRKRCMIGTGSMTDPYIPLEKEINYTRRCLEVISKYQFGVSIITKSNLILRDLDLLTQINTKAKCVVQMTLTTFDEKLCSILEPNVCTTKERYKVLKILQDRKIPTIVWLDPFLPFINDTEENLRGLLEYCFNAKVFGITNFGIGLTLRDGNREYFYSQLDKHFPGLSKKYHQKYGYSYEITSDNNSRLMKIFYAECNKHNVVCNNNELFKYMCTLPDAYEDEQIRLF